MDCPVQGKVPEMPGLFSQGVSPCQTLRPPTRVPNDIPTPSCKSSFISEPVDISILKVSNIPLPQQFATGDNKPLAKKPVTPKVILENP